MYSKCKFYPSTHDNLDMLRQSLLQQILWQEAAVAQQLLHAAHGAPCPLSSRCRPCCPVGISLC